MLLLGVLIYSLLQFAGHYYVEGVGYSTIQAILSGNLGLPVLATSAAFRRQAFRHFAEPRLGCVGRRFLAIAVHGRNASAAASALVVNAVHPIAGLSVPTCAIIGMAAMVGGGTGAAMTAVTMIFEMTRDYDLVMPSIVAVALAIGVRRMLSQENIYTIKLVGRGHTIPKAMHANMFLIRRAGEVMERDVCVVPADADFDAFLRQHGTAGGMKHVVVTRGNRVTGVVRVNTSLRRGIEAAYSGISLGASLRSR